MSQTQTVTMDGGPIKHTTGETITNDLFGGVFVGYRGIERFEGFLDTANSGMVRWPGGHAAESTSWYGLEFHDLVAPDSNKAGLTEVLAFADENDLDLAIVVPTLDFNGDLAGAHNAVYDFLERLLSGDIGELPERVTLELGNEYYAISAFSGNPAAYGEVANAMLEGVAEFIADHPDLAAATDISTAVQFGRNANDDAAIRETLSNTAFDTLDTLIYHRYSWTMDGADTFVEHYNAAFQNWVDDGASPDTDIFVSEWNIASFSRVEALRNFESLSEQLLGRDIDTSRIDLNARNDTAFEQFWQTGKLHADDGSVVETQWGLENRDYGLAQASGMLEVFSALLATGADTASLYGIDTGHAARVSFADHQFVPAAMFQMMSETLPGTSMIETGIENARDGDVNVHAFEGEGRLVIYVSADDFANGQTNLDAVLDLRDFDIDIQNVTARRLTSEPDPDWMETFDIPDVAGVDETPEARLYEQGVVSNLELSATNGQIDLEFSSPYEVIELVIQTSESTDLADQSSTQPNEVRGADTDDVLIGTNADDEIRGGRGEDHIEGKLGHDLIFAGDHGDVIYAGGGDDVVYSGLGRDYVHLGRGNDYFIDGNQNSSWGDSVVIGGAGNDEIYGRGGDDTIDGGIGDDIIDGGNGDDVIDAGSGENFVIGGAGNDQFVFDTPNGRTTITDFDSAHDQVNLSQLLDGYAQYSVRLGDQEISFVGTSPDNEEAAFNVDIRQDGNDVVVMISEELASDAPQRDFIVLEDTNLGQISAEDFVL